MDGNWSRARADQNRYITFRRKFTPGDATSRRDVPFAADVRGVYGNPTLRAMHPIHKCVAKGRSTFISLTAVECVRWTHSIKSKTKTATCEQAPRSLFLF